MTTTKENIAKYTASMVVIALNDMGFPLNDSEAIQCYNALLEDMDKNNVFDVSIQAFDEMTKEYNKQFN